MYNKQLIGKKIARGGDRSVYMYGKDRVIKISGISFLTGRTLHDKFVHDYQICKKYLPDFVVETMDATPEGERTHVEIQPFIRGPMLRIEHMRNPKIKMQLQQIQHGIERMTNDGYPPIDVIGHRAPLSQCMSNIIVDEHDDLKIIDSMLLECESVRFGMLVQPVFWLGRTWQKNRMRSFLQ